MELVRLSHSIKLLLHIADKDRELGDAHAEIKALKYSERLKEKAVEEVLQLILAPSAVIFLVSRTRLLYGWMEIIIWHFFESINMEWNGLEFHFAKLVGMLDVRFLIWFNFCCEVALISLF